MYKVFTCSLAEESQDIPIALLADAAESFVQHEDKFLVYFIDEADNQNFIQSTLERLEIPFELSEIEDKNWNEEWEKNFDSVYIDSFIQIRAAWHPELAHMQHHFLLSPKMAFGTGHHPTTYMMLERMRVCDPANKSILDVGCGSGILGVMAKKLGAAKVVMVDIEKPAVENAWEHAKLNEVVVDEVLLGTLDVVPIQPFDIIYANIQKSVILPLLKPLQQYVHADSIVQFSGILENQLTQVKDAAIAAGWTILHEKIMGGWSLLEVKRSS